MHLLAAINPINNPALSNKLGGYGQTGGASIFSNLAGVLINFALIIGVIAFIFMFLFGALQWITSGGDKEGLKKAQNRITHALFGLVVLFSLYAILYLLGAIFGLNLVKFTIPTL